MDGMRRSGRRSCRGKRPSSGMPASPGIQATSTTVVVYRLENLAVSLTLVFGVVLLMFLICWHLLLRIEHLARNPLIVNHL